MKKKWGASLKDILPELNGKDYIEKLQEDYELRFCRADEREQLVDFLRKYWRENHIFVLRPDLLDWQHLDRKNNRYNYVVAQHRKSGDFHSILGFVPTSQYDDKIEKMEVWPCIWKSRPDINVKGLGVSLYYYMKSTLPIETISILGISDVALSIYKHWNFRAGKMKHYYILNDAMEDFHLVKDYQSMLTNGYEAHNSSKSLERCTLQEFLSLPDQAFGEINRYKSKEYFVNRFFHHPIYHYETFLIKENGNVQGVLIARVCRNEEYKCLRIMDMTCREDKLCGMLHCFRRLLREENYEYIDFVEYGLDDEMLRQAGFIDKEQSGAVVPNHFEPFCLENIDLDYAYKTVSGLDNPFFKADADQDRPSRPM